MQKSWPLVIKDLKLFVADPKGMIITLAVPIAIATFMAMIFGGAGSNSTPSKLDILVVDRDQSPLSKAVIKSLASGTLVNPKSTTDADAIESVRKGKSSVALIIPKGFGKDAPQAMFFGDRPKVEVLFDPSQSLNLQVVRGAVIQSMMEQVSKVAFSAEGNNATVTAARASLKDSKMSPPEKKSLESLWSSLDKYYKEQPKSAAAGSPGARQPFDLVEKAQTSESSESQTASVAHIFAGMCIQGVLFFGIDAGMGLLRDRRLGIWKRIKASPLSEAEILFGKALSGAMISAFVILAIFVFGFLAFHLRVSGSAIGFGLMVLMSSIMTASFGLFIAALGRTEAQSRGFSTFAVIMMSMLGGAWFPSFLLPQWVQTVSLIVPVKWAVDGFDAVLWRGGGLADVIVPCSGLTFFTLLFAGVALWRFKTVPESS